MDGWDPASAMNWLMFPSTASRLVRAVCCAAFLVAAPAAAQDRDVYMGIPVDPMGGTFEATSNANLRAVPKPEGRRIGVLKVGTEVEAVGRKGAWIAVRSEGEDLGFVYEPLLKIVVLPPLDRDAQGRVLDDEGNPLTPATGRYMVTADVNIRFKPTASSTKRGQIEAGKKVLAFGSTKDGEWLAVRRDGKELGFVVAEALAPLIDGTLDAPLTGESNPTPLAACRYAIRFSGKGAVQGEAFQTADYDIDWQCRYGGEQLEFYGFMFITEAPLRNSGPPIYQISIELYEVEVDYDESFSTVFLYHRQDKRVVFDGVNIERFAAAPAIEEQPAEDVPGALRAAARMAPSAWSTALWDALARKQSGG